MEPQKTKIEILFLGSLPFLTSGQANRWLEQFPHAYSFRVQLPQRGEGYDMISEVPTLSEMRGDFVGQDEIFRKDQLVGPSTYLQIEGDTPEKRATYRELLSLRISFLEDSHAEEKVFCLDEPMLTEEGLLFANEVRSACVAIRQASQKVMLHSCQTALTPNCQEFLLALAPDILSLPLRLEHRELLERQLRSGAQVCLGLSEQAMFSENIAEELKALMKQSKKTLFLSTECGLGLLAEPLATKLYRRLYELANTLRGFSSTL